MAASDAVAEPSSALSAWRKGLVGAYLLLGGAIDYAVRGYSAPHRGVPAVGASLLIAATWLVIVGLVVWAVSRWRARRAGKVTKPRFRDAVTGWPALLIALAFCLLY